MAAYKKNGSIRYLTPDLEKEILRWHGRGLDLPIEGKCSKASDIINNIKVGMFLGQVCHNIERKYGNRYAYVVSPLTMKRRNICPIWPEANAYVPLDFQLIKRNHLRYWFVWFFMPSNHEEKTAAVAYGIIYSYYNETLMRAVLRDTPEIVIVDIQTREPNTAREIIEQYGCKLNWKAIETYGINCDAPEGGEGKQAFFPFLIS